MGGRNNVIEAPFVELLSYLITNIEEQTEEARREQVKYYMDFISRVNSNQPQSKEQAKNQEKFTKLIAPQRNEPKKLNLGKPKWNKRVQEKIERRKRLEEKEL